MEYDRALFRVYERIMEDLNATPSPLALPSTPSSAGTAPTAEADAASPGRGGVRRRRRRADPGRDSSVGRDGDAGTDGENHSGSPESARSSGGQDDNSDGRRRNRQVPRPPNLARRQFSSGVLQQQVRREQMPLPFILPIGLARKLEGMNRSLDDARMAMAGPNSGNVARLWAIVRTGLDRRHASYDSVSTSPSTPSSRPLALSPGGSNHRDDSYNNDENLSRTSDDVETGGGLQLTPINTSDDTSGSSSEGLRRRSPSRRRQSPTASPTNQSSPTLNPSSSRIAAPPIPHASTPSSVQLQPRPSRSPESASTSPNRSSAPTRSLAQRAIQMQLRQSERFSTHGGQRRHRGNGSSSSELESDDSDTSDDEYDSDDTSSSSSSDNDGRRHDSTGNEGCSQRNLHGVMRLSFVVAVFHIFVLISLHVTYVGPHAFRSQTRVAPVDQLKRRWRKLAARFTQSMDEGRYSDFVRGLVMGSEVDGEEEHDIPKDATATLVNCISYALSTRPIEERSSYFGEEKDAPSESNETSERRFLLEEDDDEFSYVPRPSELDFDDDEMYYRHKGYTQFPRFGNAVVPPLLMHDDEYNPQRAMEESSATGVPLLGKDEILQIKILHGGKCTGRCSRVRNVRYPAPDEDGGEGNNSTEADSRRLPSLQQMANSANNMRHGQGLRGEPKQNERQSKEKPGEEGKNATTTKDDELSSPSYWESVHYRFAIDDALLFLDEKSASIHNITVVNVTVTERCLSTGSDDGKLTALTATGQFLSQIYGMDSVMINQLMYGIRGKDEAFTPGYVKNMDTQERWGWHKEQLESFEHNSFIDWVLRKTGIVFMSTLAFFLITSVTSLIVRVLTSSGVVLMFPLFTFFRSMGMPGADERILSLSYPWIGSARSAIADQNVHPQSHLVMAHVTKIILYYVMYEACQAAWSVVLYAKSIPEALPIWIYGFAMIWEYFSMVFVRSALSVHFFPRMVFLYFFVYHVYFYSVPYGYFDVALIPLFLFMTHAMLYTILGLEAPNSARGVINVECPREVYNRLSWPEPIAALPAEWTMFLPLNSRLSPLHDRAEVTNNAPNEDNGENTGTERQ